MLRNLLWLALALLPFGNAAAQAVITEVMADNESTLPDEDGAFSDWIEIHNPTSAALDLGGWHLTDSAATPEMWRFPEVTLEPGGFLVVFASGKNRTIPGKPLHTNFSLSKNGEYLALVQPDGTTVAQAFSPGFPALKADESYGSRFVSTRLVTQGATGRYRAAISATDPATGWNQRTFTDTAWASGRSGYGYGITVPGITVRQVSKNGSVTGLTDALNLVALPAGDPQVLKSTTAVMETLNFLGEGADSHYGFNQIAPGGGGENYVIIATGFITIPTAGTYTFGLNSDDGGRIRINSTVVMNDDSFHAPQDSFGSIYLTKGDHSFEVIMFEGGGGDCLEFFAAPGATNTFDPATFRLVGDTANGGLAASTVAADSGGVIGSNVANALSGRNGMMLRHSFSATGPGDANTMSLVVRCGDGFSAWLNGQPAGSANSPLDTSWNALATAARNTVETLRPQAFNVTGLLPSIVSGTNVLAVHGMKSASTDTTFLLLPELIAGRLDPAAGAAYYGGGLATPGWINGTPASLGYVADTKFSVNRGFFTAPIDVTVTSATPGATIRYTLDGSTPGPANGQIVTGPIRISSTTVLRAIATLDGWTPSNIDTQTYLFPADILTQSPARASAAGWPSGSGTAQILDLGMDSRIVNHADPEIGGTETVRKALLSLPTVAVTTDLPNLFNMNGSAGIYANPGNRGYAWERPCSVEWILPPDAANPNGTTGFQIDAGLRMRGGYSRSTDNPKHALRFYFRGEYGAPKLRYPLFGRDGAAEFDQIDLRTSQNYSWSFEGSDRNTFLREESSRQALLDMGNPGSHVRYAHVYLNGQYWGLYNLDERTEASFAETYLGGAKEDYDVIKAEPETGYATGATDGNTGAWLELYQKAKTHRASPTNANYFLMMGLAADGTTPTADPALLDPDALIDYLLLTFWSGNLDGCVSLFLGNERANNWFGSRMRINNPRQGFRFFAHDFEHSLLDVNEDRTGPFNSANESNPAFYNPLFLHQDLTGNAEYRMRWADRIQRHLFESGALTPAAWQNRINRLAAAVDGAIAAESARWGDSKRSTPFTRADWVRAQQALLAYLPPRQNVVLAQLRADNLYPSIDAPVLSPAGGYQANGTAVAVSGPAGATLHYMADGSDPRAVGGSLKPGALTYVSSTISETLVPWSASAWKYLGDGTDPGATWAHPSFNDGAWRTGAAELGYGDGDEATGIPIVDVNPSMAGVQKPATCYFRRRFDLADASNLSALTLRIEYDDAFAVYLNGTRVAGNLPLNVTHGYYSGAAIEDTIETVTLPASALTAGSNVIAVEVHQANASSSDLSMNLSLTATRLSTQTPLTLSGPGRTALRFRAKNGTTWSALSESVYQVGTVAPTAANLVISELSYQPADPHGLAEFIELANTGGSALDLGGARFIEGIDFTFPEGTVLTTGARLLVVRDRAAFEALHGTGLPVVGVFANGTSLNNGGERIVLEDKAGNVLADLTYLSSFPWPAGARGGGRTLVLANPADPANPESWRPSTATPGNPGTSDTRTRQPGEDLLTHALAAPLPTIDRSTMTLSVKHRLGADSVSLVPEWSADCRNWQTAPAIRISDTPGEAGTATRVWQIDGPPATRGFFRIRVNEQP